MEQQAFDLEEFRSYLIQLEKELSSGVKQSADYQGEVDDVIEALKRLIKELKDKKYQQILPDLFGVLNFMNMLEEDFEEDESEDYEDFEDEDEFEDDDFEDEDEDESEEEDK